MGEATPREGDWVGQKKDLAFYGSKLAVLLLSHETSWYTRKKLFAGSSLSAETIGLPTDQQTNGPTDRRINRPTDQRTDGWTHLLTESRLTTKNLAPPNQVLGGIFSRVHATL